MTRGLLILETVVDLIGLRRPEDTARIEADIAEITAERMQLRLKLTDGIKEEN